MIAVASYPCRREEILKQRASGTLILLSLEEGQYYALEEVGARVWELCDGTRSVAEMAALLAEEYEAPAATIEADVMELLEELTREKLVAAGP